MSEDIRIPKHHYNALIEAVNSLVAVSNNAANTILEGTPYESMLSGPVATVQAALVNMPGADVWDGVWRDEDVEFTNFRHHSQPDHSGADAAITALHRPTGLSVESYGKPTADANKASALRGLKGRVERYKESQGIT